ncbi:MAG TPA: LuxR C-terminal-related transcriptional regulator, partial [Mycobacterium sp.]
SEPGYWPWPDVLANALVIDGRLSEADAFLRPHEERARVRGHRSAMARLGYARGRLLGAQGDLGAARARFEESLALLDGLPLRYDLARINFAYGQTLRRAGKRRDADVVIGTARELYLSLGAQTYVVRCERELKAGGLNQLRGSRDSVELTPQEEAVTTLVAQGLSNREVAAELYVSPKTVQYHLTRVYAKLGVRSRAELAALRR